MSTVLDTEALLERYIPAVSPLRYELQFTPTSQRHAATALLAFEREMRALVMLQKDVAPVKIHWWHEELQRLQDRAPRHPLTQALAQYASDALHSALNEMLHGAVMDFNAVEIDAPMQQRYFHMRGGAVHAALAAAAGRSSPETDDALAMAMTLTEILAEARDPGYANVPAATLMSLAANPGQDASPTDAEQPLREQRERAAQAAREQRPPSVTSAVRLALYNARWPLIMATPYGTPPPDLPAWRTLWIAWRAASRFVQQDNDG